MGSSKSARATLDPKTLHLALLGPPVARWGEQVVTFRTRKEFALLAYLALMQTPQPRKQLATLFWPEHDDPSAANLLRTTLSRLRQHLATAGSTTVEAITLLHTERDALGREVLGVVRDGWPRLTLDTELVQMRPEGSRSLIEEPTERGKLQTLLQAGVDAYRSEFFTGVNFDDAPELDEWVNRQRVYWQEQVERLLARLAALQLEQRAFGEASATARRWLVLNELSEPAYQALMRTLAGVGERAAALAVYEQCRTLLRAQLDIDPSPETMALAERLRHLPVLSTRDARLADKGTIPSSSAQPVRRSMELPFVGREREFAGLVDAYQAARQGQVRLVILEGDAGIGKSRLAQEFLSWATLEGAAVLSSRGGEWLAKMPHQMLVDALRPRLAREHAPEDLVDDVWLSELVRLFPELRERYPDLPIPTALAGDEVAGQGRLFEAVVQLFLALAERAKPGALVLYYDDFQWADQATRDLVRYRLQRQRELGSPHLLLLAVQTEILATTPELEHWLALLARQIPTTRLSLAPLAQTETEQAIAAWLERPAAARLSAWLQAQTAGHPFFIVETVRALIDRGILTLEGGAAEDALTDERLLAHFVPSTVRQLIQSKLGSLSAPALEMLTAAAVLGDEATYERLCRLAELDENAGLAALDELRRRRLVEENVESGGEVRLRFSHNLVREVVYTEAGEARRRIFHRRAVALLERSGAAPAELVHHALAAGLIEPALHYSLAAGDAARALFAAHDALAHYEQAQRLLAGPQPASPVVHPAQRHDWGEAPAVTALQGRNEERALLARWVREERCRVVEILGAGGIGKTTLVARLAQELAPDFEVIYWRSLRNGLPPEEWLVGAIALLSAPAGLPQSLPPEGLAGALGARLRRLLDLLRNQRALLVLDNLESILEPGMAEVRYRPGYEAYRGMLQQLAESVHQGCLLLTSREQPLRANNGVVRVLRLAGLGTAECRALLDQRALAGDAATWQALVGRYTGNPLALGVVGETIHMLFGGDIAAFLAQQAVVFGDIRQLLEEQLVRLSSLEQSLLSWLAVEREPVGIAALLADLGAGVAGSAVVEALEALQRRSLLERGSGGSFTLQPVVLEYVSERLVGALVREILAGEPLLLRSHALVLATAKDYVRRSQEQLLAGPLLAQLEAAESGTAGEQALLKLLAGWRNRPRLEQGYGPGNVLNLLRLRRGNLQGMDFSHLSLRQAHLVVAAQDASLAGAHLAQAVLAEPFDTAACTALSADGRYLAAGMPNGDVRLWRVADRTPVLAVSGHGGSVWCVALSADGQLVASSGLDGTVRLWETSSGRPLAALEGHTAAVHSVALSADGQLVASSGADGTVRLWETSSSRPLAVLQGHTAAVRSVALSADGQLVASGGVDGTVRLWETSSGRPLAVLEGHAGGIGGVALSTDGQLVASSGLDGTVRLWETSSGRPLAALEGHTAAVHSVALSADGQLVVSGGGDGTVRLWETSSSRPLAVLQGHTAAVRSATLSADGQLVASSGGDGTVRLWETSSGRPLAVLEGHASAVAYIALSADGQLVASSGGDGAVRLWETSSGRSLAALEGHAGAVSYVALSADGQLVASSGLDGTVRLWETSSGRPLAVLEGHAGEVWGTALSADGQLVASCGVDGTVRLWETSSGHSLAILEGHAGEVWGIALSADGRLVAGGCGDGTVRLWETSSGRPLAVFKGHASAVSYVALSADGQLVASSGGDGTVRLWETSSGRPLAVLEGHTREIGGVALSADGQLVASGGADGNVRLWETSSDRPLAVLEGHTAAIWNVALSADGQLVASGCGDGIVRLWNAQTGVLLRALRPDRLYERMDISGLTGVTPAQRDTLLALGAMEWGA